MSSNSAEPVARSERESELSQLIRSFTAARDAGNLTEATRLIDRAWRHASENPEINFLYGRLRLEAGAFDQAERMLAQATAGRAFPDYEAAYISALCSGGRLELARQRLDRALREFMVVPGGALARAARLVAEASADVPGWIAVGPDLAFHGEILGQSGTARLEIAGEAFPPRILRIKCAPNGLCCPFKTSFGAAGSGHVTARLNDRILLGGKRDLPPDFGLDGRVRLSKGTISGWATLKWDPSRPLTLTFSGQGGFTLKLTGTPDPTHLDRQLFSIPRTAFKDAGDSLNIQAIMPDGSQRELPVSPILLRPPPAPASPPAGAKIAASDPHAVYIVIPVYSGVDDTLTCIRSAIATAMNQAEIVVINDASPDPDMATALESLAAAGGITLLRNARNIGFPATANRGIELYPDRDVVLLNADTELYGDWLARLRAAAYGDSRIATATPLTNSGSIASYPTSETPDMPSVAAEVLDGLAAQTNRGIMIDVPTAVGFCMYMRRDAIDEVGLFDDKLFAKGYGEENDFCLRATKAGWRHVLAADIYVRHAGSRSFGSRRAALMERNLTLLNLRHRGYDATIRDYLERDPVHVARRRLDEARLIGTEGRHVLIVSLALGGGVSRAVQERITVLRESGLRPLLLMPDKKADGVCTLTTDAPDFGDLRYESATEVESLRSLLGSLNLDHIELHHFLDLPPDLIESLFTLDCPLDITVHDYVWYCPRITLLNRSKQYCGEPEVGVCQSCVDRNGARLKENITVAALRERSRTWLGMARNVFVPSPSVEWRMSAQFPDVTFRVETLESDLPDPVRAKPRANKRSAPVKVALIGAIGDHKGYKILLAMAQHAAKQDLPLDFVVIGFTKNDQALMKTGKVFVTGHYRDEEDVPELIRREAPDVILFLSVFPESWCYSLSHALRARIPVAALAHGALADRLQGTPAEDLLFPTSSDATDICDRLLLAFRPALSNERNRINPLLSQNGSSRLPRKPDILANAPALAEPANSSRTVMAKSTEPTASVNFLPLAQGLYLFSVRSAHSGPRAGEQIALPAIQIAAAPGTPAGQVEFMMGASTANGWLIDWNDQIIAKVTGPAGRVSLMSVLIPGMTPLEIEIQRLDQERPESQGLAAASAQREFPPLPSTGKSLPLEVTAHIQNRGDTTFREAQWAGLPDQRLWIESIAIMPREGISADAIEYKAITATGVETPWVTGGAPCGTRGIGVPITGFALRVKPQPGAPQLTCEYGAICMSGAMIGPVRNGAPCYSADTSDPIIAIWTSISGKIETTGKAKGSPQSAKKAEKPTGAGKKVETQSDAQPVKSKKSKIGPRFSVFREPTPSEHE